MPFGFLSIGVHHCKFFAKIGEDESKETSGLGEDEGYSVLVTVAAHPPDFLG